LWSHRVVLGKEKEPLPSALRVLPASEITDLVNKMYNKFCSGAACCSNHAKKLPAYKNMLLRIRDFATIVEASQAMRAGDPGRLMYMWEQWAVMSQALPKLPHYSKHLPRLILMLKHDLPRSVGMLVESTLLVCPTGRKNRFLATDQFLELQNYWLKHYFNNSGIGTDILRLKDVFSINIPVASLQNLHTFGHTPTYYSHMVKKLTFFSCYVIAPLPYAAVEA
jgi:hypothetical protein